MAFADITSGPVDRGTFDVFRRSVDPRWIEEALHATGTGTVRKRRLPAEQVFWLVVGMALFRDLSMQEVVRQLGIALPSAGKTQVAPSAITQARKRLGADAVRWVFERSGAQWAHESARNRAWRGLSVYGLDGTTANVPDSEDNRRFFGPVDAAGWRGMSGYPMVRMVVLMALRSHLLAGVRFGPYGTGEVTNARELWSEIPEDSLVVVDRGFQSAAVLIPIARDVPNRHWLIRARKRLVWTVTRKLGPGDELVEMTVRSSAAKANETLSTGEPWPMRAIRYKRRGFRAQTLLTSLVDADRYPAQEIVALYHERWELELGFDEVKTQMLEREEAIRSRTPEGVEQELWGLLLAYNLVRREMEKVADDVGVAPSRVSFIAALRMIRTTLMALVFASPGVIPKRLRELRADLGHFILPERRPNRSFPRAVKVKMSGYRRKHPKRLRGRTRVPAK